MVELACLVRMAGAVVTSNTLTFEGVRYNMSSRVFAIFVIGMITTASALLGAAPASAADTWTVTPGGSVAISGGPFTIYSGGTTVYRCSFWGTRGQFRSGTGLPGAGIGTIMQSSFTFGGCSGQFSISIQPNWPVNASSYRSDWNWAFGTIDARILVFGPSPCGGIISAPVSFIYDNNAGVLWSQIFQPVVAGTAAGCIVTLGRADISPMQAITSP